MPAWLTALPIQTEPVLGWVYVVTAVLLAVQLVPVIGERGRLTVRVGWIAAAAGVGALAGWLAVWWVVDVEDVFGAPASDVIRAAATAGGAAVGVGVVALVRSRWWRKVLAVLLIPLAVASAGLMINRDVAYYPTLGDVWGATPPQTLIPDQTNHADGTLAAWKPPAGMPSSGSVVLVTIPGLESHFHARQAWVYRPPAALVKNPPRLPVVIAMAGQPGGPSDVFQAGQLQTPLDAIASAHRGLAPIVVVPDQLGSYNVNPMCENSPMGNVETYITRDVRSWTLKHLPVSENRREWTVAGFSEGATCAVQFATEFPGIFGSFIAVSPELGPFDGTLARTLREAFGNSRKAYDAAQPIAVMRRHRHYPDTRAIYSVGAGDTRYGAAAPQLAAESRKVGMHTSFEVLQGVAHNWNTGALGLKNGLYELLPWWGIK